MPLPHVPSQSAPNCYKNLFTFLFVPYFHNNIKILNFIINRSKNTHNRCKYTINSLHVIYKTCALLPDGPIWLYDLFLNIIWRAIFLFYCIFFPISCYHCWDITFPFFFKYFPLRQWKHPFFLLNLRLYIGYSNRSLPGCYACARIYSKMEGIKTWSLRYDRHVDKVFSQNNSVKRNILYEDCKPMADDSSRARKHLPNGIESSLMHLKLRVGVEWLARLVLCHVICKMLTCNMGYKTTWYIWYLYHSRSISRIILEGGADNNICACVCLFVFFFLFNLL